MPNMVDAEIANAMTQPGKTLGDLQAGPPISGWWFGDTYSLIRKPTVYTNQLREDGHNFQLQAGGTSPSSQSQYASYKLMI
jgi:hypothetical protein